MAVDWECTIDVGSSNHVTHVVDNSQTSDVMVLGYTTPSSGLGSRDIFAVFLDWQGSARQVLALGQTGNAADVAKMAIETHDHGYLILGEYAGYKNTVFKLDGGYSFVWGADISGSSL